MAAFERELSNWPCDRGRLLLEYGRWQPRRRRIASAAAQLSDDELTEIDTYARPGSGVDLRDGRTEKLVQVFIVALAIAAGVLIANTIVRPRRALYISE